jgi:hypothetical protein
MDYNYGENMIYYCHTCGKEKSGCIMIDVVSKCIDCNIQHCYIEYDMGDMKLFRGGICRSCLKEKVENKENKKEKTKETDALDLVIEIFGG